MMQKFILLNHEKTSRLTEVNFLYFLDVSGQQGVMELIFSIRINEFLKHISTSKLGLRGFTRAKGLAFESQTLLNYNN
jgi:hypothetical protein